MVRWVLAAATAVFAILGLALRDDPRWFAASGLCGLLWGGWDFVASRVLDPLGDWASHRMMPAAPGGSSYGATAEVDDAIRRLEDQWQAGSSRQEDLRIALQLADLHRVAKRDPESARRVLARARERYPDAPELRSRE